MAFCSIREITREDVDSYSRLRIEMIEAFPLSFGVDIHEIRTKDDEWWRQDVERVLDDPNSCRYFAYIGDTLVGMVGIKVEEGCSEIGSMYVKERHQRQGIGGKLIDAAVNFAMSLDVNRQTLWVHESNEKAIALYESKGFDKSNPIVTKERFDGQGLEVKMTRSDD